MYRIRFHGRGGQGMKTASRILGRALFLEGFEVQDAPRYGAERRGAPIFAYVRADTRPIHERGIITRPDLVVVADDTLVTVPAAGVMQGVDAHTVLLIASADDADTWADRLKTDARILIVPPMEAEGPGDKTHVGVVCAGAAARLTGKVSFDKVTDAVRTELSSLSQSALSGNVDHARSGYDAMAEREGMAGERADDAAPVPDWIDLPFEPADISAPTIHKGLTSVLVRTGLWRTLRPVLDAETCKKCTWVCGSVCPDGVIGRSADGYPDFDYDHCKGCMICVAQCPRHAILAVPEAEADEVSRAAGGAGEEAKATGGAS